MNLKKEAVETYRVRVYGNLNIHVRSQMSGLGTQFIHPDS
jgi:hypothetical protein